MVDSILLGFSLAADAVSVSIACAVRAERVTLPQAASMALTFGVFQGIMPILGWIAGYAIASYVQGVAPYIAAVVFLALGAKMIREGWSGEAEARDWPSRTELLALAVATSIDALVVGATLAVTGASITVAATVIALITAATCALGLAAGRQLGAGAGPKAGIIGGLMLVLLAFREVLVR